MVVFMAGMMVLILVGCVVPTPDIGGDVNGNQSPLPEEKKVYPLVVLPGDWMEYEVLRANNFQLLPGIVVSFCIKVTKSDLRLWVLEQIRKWG